MVKGSLEPSASLQCEGPQDADATFSSLIFPRRPEYKQRIIYGSVFCLVVASLQTILVLLALGKLGVGLSAPDYSCLYALGGGKVSAEGGFPQPRLHDKNSDCPSVVKHYIEAGQYDKDVHRVGAMAMQYYTEDFPSEVDSHMLLVFDIDETTLSNRAEFQELHYGRVEDASVRARLLEAAESPPLQPILDVYLEAFRRGMSVTFITGRGESGRSATVRNLKAAGYGSQCESDADAGDDSRSVDSKKPASVYKPERRRQLEDLGHEIVGSFGDQFSDLEGTDEGVASWKLPNPMYYIL